MPKARPRRRKARSCKMCEIKVEYVDYKDIRILRDFLNEKGKILPRRLTGNCAKHQKMVKDAVKRARQLALIPYIKY